MIITRVSNSWSNLLINGLHNRMVTFILVGIITEVCSQCCQSFDGQGCISCPQSMHLYRGGCVYDQPYCSSYNNLLKCENCNPGYILDKSALKCILPGQTPSNFTVFQYGFIDIPASEFNSPYIKNLSQKINKTFSANISITGLIKLSARSYDPNSNYITPQPNQARYLRFVFATDSGFFQILCTYLPPRVIPSVPDGIFSWLRWKQFTRQNNQNYGFYTEPEQVQAFIKSQFQNRYPQFKSYLIIDIFRYIEKVDYKTNLLYTYRFFLFSSNTGLIDISITLTLNNLQNTPNPNPQTISYDVLNLPPNLQGMITTIQSLINFQIYLQNSVVSQFTLANGTIYNVTFKHPDINNDVYSYITFVVDQNDGKLSIKDSYLYKKNPELFKSVNAGIPVGGNTNTQGTAGSTQPGTPNLSPISQATPSAQVTNPISNINNVPITNPTSSSTSNTVNTGITNPSASTTGADSNSVSSTRPSTSTSTTTSTNANIAPTQPTSPSQSTSTTQPTSATQPTLPTQPSSSTTTSSSSSTSGTSSTTTTPRLVITNNPLLNANPRVGAYVNEGYPTFKVENQNLNYYEYLRTENFFKTNVFDAFRKLLLRNENNQSVIGGDLLRASVAENTTHYIYEIAYKLFEASRKYQFFIVTLRKDNGNFQLLRQFSVSLYGRQSVEITNQNRQQFLQRADPNIKGIMNGAIAQDPFYRPQSKLLSLVTLQFNNTFSPTSNQTKLYKIFVMKYMFPDNVQVNYEFVQFRFQITDNNTQNKRNIGKVIFDKEQFIELGPLLPGQQASFSTYIVNNFLGGDQSINFTILSAKVSTQRPTFYKVQFNKNNDSIAQYLFQFDNSFPPQELSNITIEHKKPQPPPPPAPAPVPAPTPTIIILVFNIYTFIERFPYRKYPSVWVTEAVGVISANNSELTTDKVQVIISNFFTLPVQTIYNVGIVRKQSLFRKLDCYTVRYSELLPTRINGVAKFYPSPPRMFRFQIPRRRSRKLYGPAILYLGSSGLPSQSIAQISNLNSTANSNPNTTTNSSKTQAQPINVSKSLTNQVSSKVLSFIFNKSIRVNGQIVSNSTADTIGSRGASFGPILTSSGSVASANKINDAAVTSYLQKAPEIVPISYTEQLVQPNLTNVNFTSPSKPQQKTLNFLQSTVPGINTYTNTLTTIQSQRQLSSNPNSTLISLNHVFLGDIKVLASIDSRKVSDIVYTNQGFLVATNDTAIISQVPEVQLACIMLADHITPILRKNNYTQNLRIKIVNEKDVIFWRIKKIDNVNQYQFFYDFDGFFIRVGMIVSKNQNSNEQRNITNLEAVPNKMKKLKQQNITRDNKAITESLKFRPEYIKIKKFIDANLTNIFQNLTVVDIKIENPNSTVDPIFVIIFQGQKDGIKLRAKYTTSTNTINFIDAVPLNKTYFYPVGCLTQTSNKICTACSPGYLLNSKDKTCYKQINNCLFQSAELCLACQKSYTLNNNYQCT